MGWFSEVQLKISTWTSPFAAPGTLAQLCPGTGTVWFAEAMKFVQDDVYWSGTMTELKTTLRNRYPLLTDDPYSFSRQENKLSAAIRRIMPPLRRMGVEISFARQGQSGERMLRIERA